MCVCKEKQVDIVRKLLNMDVSIMETNMCNCYAVDYIAKNGCLEILYLLIVHGVYLNNRSYNSLEPTLQAKNYDIEQFDGASITPLIITEEMIELLTIYGSKDKL